MFDGLKYLFNRKNNNSEPSGKNKRFLIISAIVIIIVAVNIILEITGLGNGGEKKSVIQIIQEDLHIGVIDIIVLLISGTGLVFFKWKKGR